jgi:hypothetical protein
VILDAPYIVKFIFLLSIVIFGVKFSELEILEHKFYFSISFFINYFSNTLSYIQPDLNNLEKIVIMISIKVIINVSSCGKKCT